MYMKIEHKINEMKAKVEQTKAAIDHERSVQADILRVVLPMMEDQIAVLEALHDKLDEKEKR